MSNDAFPVSLEEIKKRLKYKPKTGKFIWRYCDDRLLRWNNRYANTRAGHVLSNGYRFIGSLGYEHRLAWYIMTGKVPKSDVDHIDRDRSNNKWSNLRPASRSKNLGNSSRKSNNKSGYKGVRLYTQGLYVGQFSAQITVNGKQRHLGVFKTGEKAHKAYCKAADKHFGEFSHHDN